MGKDSRQIKSAKALMLKAYLYRQHTLDALKAIGPSDLRVKSSKLQALIDGAGKIHSKINDLSSFIRIGLGILWDSQGELAAIQLRRILALTESVNAANASHWQKRLLVRDIGLGQQPPCLGEILDGSSIKFTFRDSSPSKVKLRTLLNDGPFTPGTTSVGNAILNLYTVEENESIVFVSGNSYDNYQIEMVILRNIAGEHPSSADLLSWLQEVVDTACDERRNVRPNHIGKMVQAGLNTGPRHARVLGWAKSFTKVLDHEDKVVHDRDVIGAAAVVWSLIKASVPREVSDTVGDCLKEAGLPTLATRNISAGSGYSIQVHDQIYNFSCVERAPPETYMTKGYVAWVHVDPAYCTYAFSLCAGRTIQSPSSTSTTHPARQTRQSVRQQTLAEEKSAKVTSSSGANFVDLDLGVLVKQATATLMVFRPDHKHGTTISHGVTNHAISLVFTKRVGDAWKEFKENKLKCSIQCQPGAGDGNPDFIASLLNVEPE